MQTYQTEHYTVKRIAQHILEGYVHDRAILEKEDYSIIRDLNRKAAQYEDYCLLVNMGYFVTISDEFKQLTTKKDPENPITARAILTKSLGHRITGNFYLKISNPQIETRLFTDRNEAIKWLKSRVRVGLDINAA